MPNADYGHAVTMWFAVCLVAPNRNLVKEQIPFVHGQMESPNISLQVIDLNPSCSGQARFNRLGTGQGYESTKPVDLIELLSLVLLTNLVVS